MKKLFLVLIAFVVFSSHDMFLKLDTYFLQPNSSATIKLFNGTFEKSENVIARDRMSDVSLVGNGMRSRVDTTQWSDQDSMTILSFKTGEAGTWIAGVSTRSRLIEMTASDFNDYLEHDGVLDMLKWREENDALEQDAVEKYSKHVKAIFQVGDKKTNDWQTELGYPIEFMPLSNPYNLYTGDELQVKLLWQGKPLANQLVYVDSQAAEHGHSHDHDHANEAGDEHSHDHDHADEAGDGHSHDHDYADEAGDEHSHDHDHANEAGDGHSHDHDHAEEAGDGHSHDHDHAEEAGDGHSHDHDHAEEAGDGHSHDHDHADEAGDGHSHDHDQANETEEGHHHHAATQLRTDANGNLTVKLKADGLWYLRTINLTHSKESGITHESNWATLTFEVGHSHAEATHSHTDGIPSYVYWIGSLVLLAGLFFWFNRKN